LFVLLIWVSAIALEGKTNCQMQSYLALEDLLSNDLKKLEEYCPE